MVMVVDRVNGVGGIVDRCVWDLCYQFGQCICMVFFGMVNDDVVDVCEVDFIVQILYKFMVKFMIDGIDQYIFFFMNEIVVIVVVMQCFVFSVVKIMYFLVVLVNLMNIIFNQNRYNYFNLFNVYKKLFCLLQVVC